MEFTWKDWGSRRKAPIRIAVSCPRSRTGASRNQYQSSQLARYGFFISSMRVVAHNPNPRWFWYTLRVYGELYKLRCLSMCNFLHISRQTVCWVQTFYSAYGLKVSWRPYAVECARAMNRVTAMFMFLKRWTWTSHWHGWSHENTS